MSFPAPQPAAEFVWNDGFLLGFNPMDDTHKEFVDVVHAMDVADDAAFPAALDRFIVHAEAHFAQEDEWMRLNDFPARECHVEEHGRVLDSAYQVKGIVEAGNIAVGRDFVTAVKDWFPGHADYLDSALAKWMVKRTTGGAPVVLRRLRPAGDPSSPQAE